MGNAQLGADLYNHVGACAQKSALDRENLTSATTSFLAYTRNIDQLQQLLNLTQRLYLFNPAQGVTDANFNSLSIQAALFKTNLMSAIGDRSNSAVSSLSQTFQRLNADMQAGKFQPFFDSMSKGTSDLANGLSWVAQNANTIAPIMAGAITAVIGFSIAMKAATLANLIFYASTATVVGGALAIVASVAAIGVGIATAKSIRYKELRNAGKRKIPDWHGTAGLSFQHNSNRCVSFLSLFFSLLSNMYCSLTNN